MLVSACASFAKAQSAADFSFQVNRAQIICAATVLSIEPPTSERNTYLIHFRVDDGIRGIQTDERLTVTEWAGMWKPGADRYRVGERYLLFLGGKKGSTSLVGGDNGRLRIKNELVSIESAARPERAMRLQGAAKAEARQVPYREVIQSIRAAMREQQ